MTQTAWATASCALPRANSRSSTPREGWVAHLALSVHSDRNNFGVIAGTFYDTNGVGHGFVRTPKGKFTVFDAPGGVGGSLGTFSAFRSEQLWCDSGNIL